MTKEEQNTVKSGTVRFIKIGENAVRELIFEFFMENQSRLFMLDPQSEPSENELNELSVSFLPNGEVACCLYPAEDGPLNFSDQMLEKESITTTSLFDPGKKYCEIKIPVD